MIQIHNEEACNEAIELAWKQEIKDYDPDVFPQDAPIMFSRGFRYSRMDYEILEARLSKSEEITRNLVAHDPNAHGCDVDSLNDEMVSHTCVWDEKMPQNCDIAMDGITKDKCKHWRKFNIKEQILCGMIEVD